MHACNSIRPGLDARASYNRRLVIRHPIRLVRCAGHVRNLLGPIDGVAGMPMPMPMPYALCLWKTLRGLTVNCLHLGFLSKLQILFSLLKCCLHGAGLRCHCDSGLDAQRQLRTPSFIVALQLYLAVNLRCQFDAMAMLP